MPIPRLQLVELEDLAWWPAIVRDLSTDYLRFMEAKLRIHTAVAPLLANAMRRSGADRIVDLCSGGGGPMPALPEALRAEGLEVTGILTDRFPNLEAFRLAEQESGGRIG